jgi:hypothetical protein
MIKLKRRQLLISAGSMASFFLVQSLPVGAFDSVTKGSELPLVIGQYYLNRFGHEAELSELKKLIGVPADSIFEHPDVLDKLRSNISDDFLLARTFKWEGWILSRTEGRLCALASLEDS